MINNFDVFLTGLNIAAWSLKFIMHISVNNCSAPVGGWCTFKNKKFCLLDVAAMCWISVQIGYTILTKWYRKWKYWINTKFEDYNSQKKAVL